MVTVECPWCAEAALLPFLEITEQEATFTCAECGTTIVFVEEPVALDLAA
jgi:predicted RNA-binding Zn-ribbon protein involved in translation (DUF1610 family)